MKEREAIRMFDHIRPETLAETDLGREESNLSASGSPAEAPRGRVFSWKPLLALAAALAIVAVSVLTATAPRSALGLAGPEYPPGTSYNDSKEYQDLDEGFLMNLGQFAFSSTAQVFGREDSEKNLAYSPLSLFYALALASEGAQGATRAELLAALKMPDGELMGRESAKLFQNLYTDNEIGKLLLANSLWLQEGVDFDQAFLDRAAREYYAHSFGVDFGDSATAKQISRWVSQHTGGKLGNDPKAFEPDPAQVMTLINTVYFYDQWTDEFDRQKTKEDVFNLAAGGTVKVPFMNKTTMSSFAQVAGCSVTSLGLKNRQQMLLILPDLGVSPRDILSDPDRLEQVLTSLGPDSLGQRWGDVILSLPKFKFTNELNLKEILKEMGVKEAFSQTADFSGLAKIKPLFISAIQQNLSMSIDEKGCEAAAYTEIRLCGSAPPEETFVMKLDRPFIFAITGGAGDAPLFIGVVNNP